METDNITLTDFSARGTSLQLLRQTVIQQYQHSDFLLSKRVAFMCKVKKMSSMICCVTYASEIGICNKAQDKN